MRPEVTAVFPSTCPSPRTARSPGTMLVWCREQKRVPGSGWWAGQGGFTLMHPGSVGFFHQPLELRHKRARAQGHAHTNRRSLFAFISSQCTHVQKPCAGTGKRKLRVVKLSETRGTLPSLLLSTSRCSTHDCPALLLKTLAGQKRHDCETSEGIKLTAEAEIGISDGFSSYLDATPASGCDSTQILSGISSGWKRKNCDFMSKG